MTDQLRSSLQEASCGSRETCPACKGDGYLWLLPPGKNAFEMGGWAVAKSSRKTTCHTCHGTSLLKASDARQDDGGRDG